MLKLLLSVGCALALLTTATVSDAKIFVKISDGTTAGTLDAQASTTVPFSQGWAAAQPWPPQPRRARPIVTDTLTHRLSCTTRPCKVYFPSGNGHPAAPLTTDTFNIRGRLVGITGAGREVRLRRLRRPGELQGRQDHVAHCAGRP